MAIHPCPSCRLQLIVLSSVVKNKLPMSMRREVQQRRLLVVLVRLRDRTALATSSRKNSTLESDVVYILCIAFMCRSDSDPRRGRRSDVGRSGREDFGAA